MDTIVVIHEVLLRNKIECSRKLKVGFGWNRKSRNPNSYFLCYVHNRFSTTWQTFATDEVCLFRIKSYETFYRFV